MLKMRRNCYVQNEKQNLHLRNLLFPIQDAQKQSVWKQLCGLTGGYAQPAILLVDSGGVSRVTIQWLHRIRIIWAGLNQKTSVQAKITTSMRHVSTRRSYSGLKRCVILMRVELSLSLWTKPDGHTWGKYLLGLTPPGVVPNWPWIQPTL